MHTVRNKKNVKKLSTRLSDVPRNNDLKLCTTFFFNLRPRLTWLHRNARSLFSQYCHEQKKKKSEIAFVRSIVQTFFNIYHRPFFTPFSSETRGCVRRRIAARSQWLRPSLQKVIVASIHGYTAFPSPFTLSPSLPLPLPSTTRRWFIDVGRKRDEPPARVPRRPPLSSCTYITSAESVDDRELNISTVLRAVGRRYKKYFSSQWHEPEISTAGLSQSCRNRIELGRLFLSFFFFFIQNSRSDSGGNLVFSAKFAKSLKWGNVDFHRIKPVRLYDWVTLPIFGKGSFWVMRNSWTWRATL